MIWKNNITIEQLNDISKNTMVDNLGITFTKIGDNFIKATMPVDDRTVQPMGILHGGASAALAETLGSVASFAATPMGENKIVGVEINANHLKSANKGMVEGSVTPVRLGHKIHVWNIEIRNEEAELLCVSRLTVMIIPNEVK